MSSRLAIDTINGNVLKAQYAVRGHIAMRSEEVSQQYLETIERFFFFILYALNIATPALLKLTLKHNATQL